MLAKLRQALGRRYLEQVVRRTVVVQTKDAQSVRGVLVGAYRDALVVSHASYLLPDGNREAIDGDVIVPRSNLAWVQVLTEVATA